MLINIFQTVFQAIAVKVQESLAKANQVATETFSCMKTVKSFANEDGETEKYRQRLEDTYNIKIKESVAYAAFSWANSVSRILTIILFCSVLAAHLYSECFKK